MQKTFWIISLIILFTVSSSWALNEQLPGLEEDNTAMTNEELRSLSIANQIKSDGKLDMYDKPIDNVEDPTDPQDAATKSYVDTAVTNMATENYADTAAASASLWETDGGDAELKTADDLDIQNMQAKGMCIENRTDDTGCTQTGRIWFRTDI